MGLDMWLTKMPRCGNATAKEVYNVNAYFNWREAKKRDPVMKNYTFEKWTGVKAEDVPPKSIRDIYEPLYVTRYPCWDTERKHGSKSLTQPVGYWRRANEIHDWFVKNLPDTDNYFGFRGEVTKKHLIELRALCYGVLCSGDIEDGEMTVDYEVANTLLPRHSVYIFDERLYDEHYVYNLKSTIKIIDKVLEETDFEKEMIYYSAG